MTTSDFSDERGRGDFIFICPSNLECVLAAGGVTDLPELRAWCEALPMKSYGRVFVEVESPVQIEEIATPPGVGITWLVRSSSAQPQGAALLAAVDGWLDEWLRGDPMSGRYVQLWSGMRDNAAAAAHFRAVEAELSDTWAAAAEYRDQLT